MDPPTSFKFPARESSPLHPLSPERINGRASTHTRSATTGTTTEGGSTQSSPAGSPTRKAHLFADYHPLTTPSKPSSSFGPANGLPQSPSLPEFRSAHGRTNSDVQGLVKRFEHLDVRDRDAEVEKLSRKHEMELRRAVLGREEAESDARKWREEFRRVERERGEGEERQVKVANRLDRVMTDYTTAKEQYASHSEAYQKEVRKARKEAFKSASAVLKLQESLRDVQKRLEVSKIDQGRDVQKARDFEQEAVDARCALTNLQQEMQGLEKRLRMSEEEKEGLKKCLREEEVARAAAEGKIALPGPLEGDEEFASPVVARRAPVNGGSPLSDDKENSGIVTKKMVEAQRLQERVDAERRKREAAEEMVEFLRMECAFKCCACATSARHGKAMRISMDNIMAQSIERMKKDMAAILSPPVSDHGEEMEVEARDFEVEHAAATQGGDDEPAAPGPEEPKAIEEEMPDATNPSAEQEEYQSMTFVAEDPAEPPEDETLQVPHPTPAHNDAPADPPAETSEETESTEPERATTTTVPLKDSRPTTPEHPELQTPPHHSIRTITTTTRIPMHFTPVSKPTNPGPFENQENLDPDCAVQDPPAKELPFDREAALAAIAYRRGRAKSLAQGTCTPRKQMVEGVGVGGRRDISAPALGGKRGGVGMVGAKGSASVGRGTGRMMGY